MILHILRGPLKGHKFSIVAGLKIGRKLGQIRIDDPKISNLHAFFDSDGGRLVLRDSGSKNGIKVGAERVVLVEVRPGLRFSIGNSEFEVLSSETQGVADAPLSAPITPSETTAQAPTPAQEPERRRWSDTLLPLLAKASEGRDQDQVVRPFDPPLKLTFLSGPQKDTIWILGYGPRIIGAHSADLKLLEPEAPPISFRILPASKGFEINTGQPQVVRINGQSLASKRIEAGDLIIIGQTIIEIGFES